MVVGIQSAYKANGGDDGAHFLGRIRALSFPILMQTTVAGVVFGLYSLFHLEGIAFDGWFEVCILVFSILLQILFFTRLVFYMNKVAIQRI